MFRRLVIGNVQKGSLLVPQDVVERMMDQHSHERPDNYSWIDLSESLFFLALLYVTPEEFVYLAHELAKEPSRHLVLLKCRIKDHPHERNVLLVLVQRLAGEMVKDAKIVICIHRRHQIHVFFPRVSVKSLAAAFCLDQGSIQFVLG